VSTSNPLALDDEREKEDEEEEEGGRRERLFLFDSGTPTP